MKLKSEKSPDAFVNRSFFVPKTNSKWIFFQPKLKLGPVNDVYEREADTIADRVMHMENSNIGFFPVQPKCSECREDEDIQKKDEPGLNSDNQIVYGGMDSVDSMSPKAASNFYLTPTHSEHAIVQLQEGDQEEDEQRSCIREGMLLEGREPTEDAIDRQLEVNREHERLYDTEIDVCQTLESAITESTMSPDIGANEIFPFPAEATVRLRELLTSHFTREDLDPLLAFAGERETMARRIVETLFDPDTPGSMVVIVNESTS